MFKNFFVYFRKITQYSPSESSKMYDKNLSRKSNSKFNPKATIQKLKYGLEIDTEDLEKAKQELIAYYLEVRCIIVLISKIFILYIFLISVKTFDYKS